MAFAKVIYRGNGSPRAIFTALSSDTKGTATSGVLQVYAGDWCYETDTSDRYEYDGNSWVQISANGAGYGLPGSAGGASAVTTLENFLVAGEASQTGTAVNFPSGRATFQAVANGSSGAYTATVNILVSNDNTNWVTAGTITLSGTATTADSDGFTTDAPWAYVRADVASFTGTGATCDVYMSK